MKTFGGIFDYAHKKERLQEVELELQQPSIWETPETAQALGKERANLESVVHSIDRLLTGCEDAHDLLTMAEEENDEDTVNAVLADIDAINQDLEKLEFRRMFSGQMDMNNAFMD